MRVLRVAAATIVLAVPSSVGRAAAAEYEAVPWDYAYAPAGRHVVRISLLIRPSDKPQRVVVRERRDIR
jgi:hypothetical protein